MTYETVHTVWDYYDGPRSGIADYEGTPCHYVSEFDDAADDYMDTFVLRRIDDATFQKIMKQWAIWRTWELAFHSGQRDKSSHPALAGQDDAYAQLGIEIKTESETLSSPIIVARADFRARPRQPDLPKGAFRELEVRWTPCNPTNRSKTTGPKRPVF